MEKDSTNNVLADEGASELKNDNPVVNGMDLHHTIRGEAVHERSRDSLQLRKGMLAASAYSRPKKSIHRRRRSRVSSVIYILTHITLLLAALFYLGQVFWRWTAGSQQGTNSSFAALYYEDRISEVQKSLNIKSKMLQVQVEVIEKKIESEIDTITRELKKYIEEKGEFIEKELKKLEFRTDDLVYSLSNLEGHELLTKEELEKFWDELESLGKDVNLDEIMALTRDIVMKEIEKHAADGLGRVDYALASGGAKVVRHSEPYVYGKVGSWLAVTKGKARVHSSAQIMLKPSFGEPGQCFPLRGSNGFAEIRLREGIIPEAITLEHVSKSVAYDRSSAPKDCQVSGWFEAPEDGSSTKTSNLFAIDFSYDLNKSNVQTFAIPTVDSGVINMVMLNFTSNHGSPSLTCIYRIRVHGYKPGSQLAVATDPKAIEER